MHVCAHVCKYTYAWVCIYGGKKWTSISLSLSTLFSETGNLTKSVAQQLYRLAFHVQIRLLLPGADIAGLWSHTWLFVWELRIYIYILVFA